MKLSSLAGIFQFLFHNTSTRQTVFKNTIWLAISNFGGRLLKAVVVIYAARMLGATNWGIFSYAVTLAGFTTLFMDLGVNGILVRDAVRATDKEKYSLFSTALFIKCCLLVVGVSIIIFLVPHFSLLPGTNTLLPIVAIIIAFDTMREFSSAFIRSMEKMEWEAGIFLFTNIAIVFAGFCFLYINPTPTLFAWGYALGTALGSIIAFIFLYRYFKKFFLSFSFSLVLPILRSAWPFAVVGALGLFLTNTDILIIGLMRSASEVGIYSSAVRIAQLLYLIPGVLQLSILPLLSRLAHTDNARFRSTFERTLALVFLVSIPLALGGVVLGTSLMGFIFGAEYDAGGLSFKILMLTLLVDFPSTLLTAAIFAYNRQKSLITSTIIAAVTNVSLDLLLIPRFGIAGSAVATLVAQLLCNWYLWKTMKKLNYFSVAPYLTKIVLAAGGMALITLALSTFGVSVFLNVVFSALLYIIFLFFLREPLIHELKLVFIRRNTL